jgi:hypothetical protein
VVLPIDASRWAPPVTPIRHGGRDFLPKRELHVTVIGKALGADVQAALADARLDAGALRAAFARGPWRARRSGWRLHLRKAKDTGAAESIVELLA